MPTGDGLKAESEGYGLGGDDGGGLGQKMNGELGGFGDRPCPEWAGQEKNEGEASNPRRDWEGHKLRVW